MTSTEHSNEHPKAPTHTSESRVVRLPYGPAALQFGELHLPSGAGPYPVAIVIHGGFWRVPYGYTLMTSLAGDLASQGIAAWNIEYRRIGDPGGGWPNTLLDVALAADFVRSIAPTHRLDLRRVVTIGHSAGGHLALWLAARPRIPKESILANAHTFGESPDSGNQEQMPLAISGAISQAGVAILAMGWQMRLGNDAVAELLGGSLSQVPERYAAASPAALLPLGVPQVLVHGTADDRVPFTMSQAYAAAARAAGDDVRLIELLGEDHFVLINASSAAWAKTAKAARELVGLK